jgi:hypothetical protein
MSDGKVYLLHFSQPIGDPKNPRGQAQHYLGWTVDLEHRLDTHAAGNGSALMAAVSAQGIDWQLARTWLGDRDLERRLKRQHNAPRLCPVCNPEGWKQRGN